MIRLFRLGLDERMIGPHPRVAARAARLFERPSYKAGTEQWFHPAAVALMTENQTLARFVA